MLYICNDCGEIFDEPYGYQTTYEHYYGCPIPTSTPLTIYQCPHCRSENWDDYYEDEEDEEEE